MNFRTVIFSGLMASLIGLMIGFALVHITGREARKRPILITSSILGFVIGSFQESVNQQQRHRAEEYGDSDYKE
ncbi:MAG: hypothetical protein AB4058_12220 [Microcystaceae cyanobacterium]